MAFLGVGAFLSDGLGRLLLEEEEAAVGLGALPVLEEEAAVGLDALAGLSPFFGFEVVAGEVGRAERVEDGAGRQDGEEA